MRYLISCCFIYFLLFKTVIGQSPVVLDLEQQVYRFNNEFKYDSSQQLIQRFLSLQTTTNEDKYFAYLYLSYTYKRLYDYTSTLSHLDQALSYGILSPRKEEFSANIKCQKALALFDIHSYDQADSLMRQLAKTNYEYLNEEYQSKIIMQEAYLLFLKKSYIAAEKRYDLAITKMTQASICDLPMIYAKKIELYEAMNKDSAMNKAYQQAIQSADSCGIFKYLMYTNEIMAETYKHRRDYENAFFYLKKAENLRTEYNQKEHLTTIADLDKKYQTSLKDYQLKHQTKQLYYLIGILFLLFLAFLSVLGGLFYLKKQRDIIFNQNRMNEHLINILSHDIKEPLLGVKLLLTKMKTQDPFLIQASQSLAKQITTVNDVLSNLLAMKRSQSDHQKQQTLIQGIRRITMKVIKDLEPKWEAKNIIIEVELPEEKPLSLPISEEKLYIIIYNLLNNAIKYSFDRGTIQIFERNGVLSIRDFGVGISKAEQDLLLKNVVNSRHGTSLETGNGLGLYLLGQLIKDTKIQIQLLSLTDGTVAQILPN